MTHPSPELSVEQTREPRTGVAVMASVAAGILLAVLWSYEFVDSVIGDNVANTLLGHEAKATPIVGTGAGLLFAFVSGFAGTFTACNIAMAKFALGYLMFYLARGPRASIFVLTGAGGPAKNRTFQTCR
jgi:hypothetical protein